MQYSIVFLSVVGLGLALPQGAPAPGQKLPFSEDSSPDCGLRGYTEDLCGTEEYCKAIDKVGTGPLGHDERFKTTKECFDAHDSKPAPQQDPDRIVFPDSKPAQDPSRIVFPED